MLAEQIARGGLWNMQRATVSPTNPTSGSSDLASLARLPCPAPPGCFDRARAGKDLVRYT